jgi:hypothetical protein
MEIKIIPLLELLNNHSEQEVESKLSTFYCEKNLDVQNFLRENSIPYEKAHTARTYLLVDETLDILAFYSLALKTICLEELVLTNGQKRKVKGYGNSKEDLYTGFLVGQLARNDNCRKEELTGNQILQFAIFQLIEIQNSIGGRFIVIDCVDELLKFYESNSFSKIGKEARLNIMVKFILKTS